MKLDKKIIKVVGILIFGFLTACQQEHFIDALSEQDKELLHKVGTNQTMAKVKSDLRDYDFISPYPPLTEEGKAFVGHYQVTISCEDRYAECNDGVVEATVVLLNNGAAHRTIVNIGSNNVTHAVRQRRDFWTYDEKLKKIIMQNTEGGEIFFNVTNQRDLEMDLERMANAKANQKYFAKDKAGFPQQAYVLKRVL